MHTGQINSPAYSPSVWLSTHLSLLVQKNHLWVSSTHRFKFLPLDYRSLMIWPCNSNKYCYLVLFPIIHCCRFFCCCCSWGMWDLSCLTRVWTCPHCIGITVSLPLDHQRSPCYSPFNVAVLGGLFIASQFQKVLSFLIPGSAPSFILGFLPKRISFSLANHLLPICSNES